MAIIEEVVLRLRQFLRLEAVSGGVLLLAAVAAIAWANLDADGYRAVFEARFALGSGPGPSLRTIIDDGLMTLFFLVVGLEIKRELVDGALSSVRTATLPALAALGGMVAPAAIFLALNGGRPSAHGWGIPMATDIAFCVGVLTLLRSRVPSALVVFVTALAIFDDIGGILVIALVYGHGLQLAWVAVACGLVGVLVVLERLRVVRRALYAIVGVALWLAFARAGIHPTMAGVVLGLVVPAAIGTRALDRLHGPVAFGVMPLFALANAGIGLRGIDAATLASRVTLGIGLGLVVGKTVGVFGTTALAVRLGFAPSPGGSSMRQLLGAAIVAGIGFTVALFIAGIAYAEDQPLLVQAKLGILIGSLLAGALGYLVLASSAPATK